MRYAQFAVDDYDLDLTFTCGQAFRWVAREDGWEGVVGSRWVRLRKNDGHICAQTAEPVGDWHWLADYLQLQADLPAIIASFPNDEPMRAALAACRGMRLLRQDPWECLASFICSATKRIAQIQQIVALLCERFGDPVTVPQGHPPISAFPTAKRLAQASEAELRACKLGFRAPNLLAAARLIASDQVRLDSGLSLEEARSRLVQLPGVGPKIADCALLFGFGHPRAFPIDVWILRALQQFYFPRRKVARARLLEFVDGYFGPHSGYAQQYLFHWIRTSNWSEPPPLAQTRGASPSPRPRQRVALQEKRARIRTHGSVS